MLFVNSYYSLCVNYNIYLYLMLSKKQHRLLNIKSK